MAGKKKEVKLRFAPNARFARFLMHPAGKAILASIVLGVTLGVFCFTYFYVKYSRLIDQTLRAGPYANTSKIFAAPKIVAIGDPMTAAELIWELRRSGYGASRGNPVGWFNVRKDAVEIFPGPEAYDQEAGVIKFAGPKISQIISLQDNTQRAQFQLEPQIITNLYDRNREKRRIVRFEDIPEMLREAILSAEDKRFFQHSGFDPLGIVRAAYVDLKQGRRGQGASTLSQQTARTFWLNLDRTWKRKAAEFMITLELEQKLSKKAIFELYCNQIDLGRRGTFAIRGFGEAAQAYFGKDIRQITRPEEAATLAGLVQRPSYFNPFRHPDRMVQRRNVVLALMRQNSYISEREYALAADAPLRLATSGSDSQEAPYFVDLVNDDLQTKFSDKDFKVSSYRIYTTLDLDLQRAASEAIRIGMQSVDEQLHKQRRYRNRTFPEAQVALIALDPHTGEIRALSGGRNYGVSQLNHVLAERQPGSVFKAFVYAAAMNTAITGGSRILTPATMVLDEPTTFWYDGKPYEPANFKHEYNGEVTLRRAIAKSMNIATIKVAEMVGYEQVVRLAKKAGLSEDIQPTPAVALGAYEATPLEMAGAYTIFANQGFYVKPNFISMVRAQNGTTIYSQKPEKRQVLDPRVTYLMVNLLEEVMRSGTAAGVRARGFTVPAAGKTGTSHDGWFAGFTSELLCVVWVGFDDNRELNLEGAHSAAPIWGEFMKRALQFRAYRNAKPFVAPDGIVSVEIDPLSGMPATPFCPATRSEVFIAGTEPVGTCPLHGGGQSGVTNVAGWEVPPSQPSGGMARPPDITPPEPRRQKSDRSADIASNSDPQALPPAQQPKKRRGLFGRIIDVFK